MQRETIREFSGKILGYVETDLKGNQVVKDFYGYIVAKYDKDANMTRDFYGRVIGYGNLAVGQLYNKR